MSPDEQVMNELKNFIFTQTKKGYEKCFWPKSDCNQDSIRAHSIQNGQILERLASNNHVIMFTAKQNLDTGPFIEFKLVGRNQATTFTGLCQQHDTELFLPIDSDIFDIYNEEQKFLIAYRSVLRELHSRIKAAIDTQLLYQKSVELEILDSYSFNKLTFRSTMEIANSYSFYRYKKLLDNMYNNNLYDEIEHDCIHIENRDCPLAVSSLISPTDNMRFIQERLEPKFIIFNVFPQERNITILFSYIKSHREHLVPYLNKIKNSSGEYQLYLLSKTIMRYCENFVISPEHFNSFTSSKTDAIKAFYYATATQIDYDCDSQDLMLF
jgi:hypothetical protein